MFFIAPKRVRRKLEIRFQVPRNYADMTAKQTAKKIKIMSHFICVNRNAVFSDEMRGPNNYTKKFAVNFVKLRHILSYLATNRVKENPLGKVLGKK